MIIISLLITPPYIDFRYIIETDLEFILKNATYKDTSAIDAKEYKQRLMEALNI